MAKNFDVPLFYRAPGIAQIKAERTESDPKRRNLSPTELDCGPLRFRIARHFGFCYGVENAIDIAYRAIRENEGKRIYLLSEMIHNPEVNNDLRSRGVEFLMDTLGNELIPFSVLTPNDVVIIPAFGTTLETAQTLATLGVNIQRYDTTCPFVQKVWKRSAELGAAGFSVVIHGKRRHEETRTTFSYSKQNAPSIIVRDLEDARFLVQFILGKTTVAEFWERFSDAVSPGFDPLRDLQRIGVVNQTTMLASETHEIAATIREALLSRFGSESIDTYYADTRDTLCYATYENQTATQQLIATGADIGLVVGGYNSSNTSHLVELCAQAFPTFYIRNAAEILSKSTIRHFDLGSHSVVETENWLPTSGGTPITIAITSGASCPDALVENVMERVAGFFDVQSLFQHRPLRVVSQ